MHRWIWMKSYEPNYSFLYVWKQSVLPCCWKVIGWGPGVFGGEAGGSSEKPWGLSLLSFSSEWTEGVASGLMGKASPWSILVSLINTPKLTFRMCSFLTLRKGFSWLPGSREQAVVSDYLEAARHKLRCFGKVGRGGGGQRDRFFFLLWTGEEGTWWHFPESERKNTGLKSLELCIKTETHPYWGNKTKQKKA